jgi:uncharacterized membrane protein
MTCQCVDDILEAFDAADAGRRALERALRQPARDTTDTARALDRAWLEALGVRAGS